MSLSSIKFHTLAYLFARIGSIFASFVLFSLIAKYFPPSDAARGMFYGFVFGFLVSTQRQSLGFIANVQWNWRRAQKLRALIGASSIHLTLSALLSIALGLYTFFSSQSALLAITAATLSLLSATDLDIYRAINNKAPLFSVLFLLGTLASIVILRVFREYPQSVYYATVAQWTFVAAARVLYVWRSRHVLRNNMRGADRLSLRNVIIALYDGAVLNCPYFASTETFQKEEALELSIIYRLFLASIPLLPLFLHFSITSLPRQIEQYVGLKFRTVFFFGSFGFGVILGGIFLGILLLTSGKTIHISSFALYTLLLLSFLAYYSQMRFTNLNCTSKGGKSMTLLAVAAVSCIFLIARFYANHYSYIIIVQSIAFLTPSLMSSQQRQEHKNAG